MSIDLAWTVEIGGLDSATDFTDRVAGIKISQPLGFMQPSAHRCFITLNNFDGALTPGAGGTYSNVDWFKQAIFISCTVNSTDTAQVFHGLLNDFDIQDDGVTSTVTISAADWFAVGARGLRSTSFTNSTGYDWTEWTNRILDSFTFQGVPVGSTSLPQLDQQLGVYSGWNGDVSFYAAGTVTTGFVGQTGDSVGDVFISRHQAGVPSVIWPTYIDKWNPSGSLYFARYSAGIVGDTLTRSDAYATTYVFTEGTPASNELPITAIDRGYDIERVINQVTITSSFTTNTVTAVDDASAGTIGIKSLWASESTMLTDTDTQRMADNIVTRFAGVNFGVRKLRIDSATLADVTADSKEELAGLLDAGKGLWQTATVTYTPTGGTQVTDDCVISGRTIQATPGRTTITLDLLPAQDYQSFVLDSDILGVLGGTLDTYDKSTYTYDENVFYDGVPILGNRLG